MVKDFTSNNPATAFISAAKENIKNSPQEKKATKNNLVKWTTYYDKDKKKKIEKIAFLEEKNIYEIVDMAITDFINKYEKNQENK